MKYVIVVVGLLKNSWLIDVVVVMRCCLMIDVMGIHNHGVVV